MRYARRAATLVGLLVLASGALAASTAGGAEGSHAATKPVIGPAATVPARPQAGKRFTASFKVTRSDTGAPLRGGKMTCTPSVGGKAIPHTDSFSGGTARVSFVVPATAKVVKVVLSIAFGGRTATRTFMFGVRPAPKPSLTIADASVAEGTSGTTTLSLAVVLSSASALPVTVAYASADGTATATVSATPTTPAA